MVIFLVLLSVVAALAIFVQRTTTQIREALAQEVLQQQHDVANLLHEYAGVMLALEREQGDKSDSTQLTVEAALASARVQLDKMRSQYSFERLDGASTAHAFVKPVLEDVQQWLTTGLPGFPATDPVVLSMASQRMSDRYRQLRLIAFETDAVATSLIAEQSGDIDRFRSLLILMLGLFALLALGIAALLIRQLNLQTQLRVDQQSHAQRIADFADIGADWFWEMTEGLKLKVLSGRALKADQNSPAGSNNLLEDDSIFASYNDKVADVHWPIERLKAHEEFAEFETDWVTSNGDRRVLAMSGKPLFGAGSEFVGYRGIGRDITERKHIESELASVYQELIEAQTEGRQQAEEALRDTEQFLRISLDAITANIAILDQDGFVRVANKAWQALTSGAGADGGIGIHYWKALGSRPVAEQEGLFKVRRSIEGVLAGERNSLHFEFPCQTSDELSWNVIHLTTFDSNGFRYAVLLYEDITERRKLEDQDRRLRADLAHVARLTTVGEMATVLAHELNQPLTAISHNTDALLSTLRENPDTDAEVMETVSDIYEQAHRAGGIIHSMRQMVRKDAHATKSVDINHLVEETVRLTQPEAREHKVKVHLHLAKDLPNLMIDAVQIQQVLVNLERNGVEAIRHHGSKTRELYISTVQDDDEFIRITVQDTGPGITPEVERNLYKSFHTTKVDGMGMGLSISRSIVEAHGGRLWLDEAQSGMTTFQFTLPIMQDIANAGV